ncbi:phasin family protein [Sphingomonas solaris]|uniref:Phasin family protein n=1 Tax=Alterirhizorhabdus solaris TaxID=2529389 RepID=A0A558R3U9_9SPHN|nr:phasin family protein [Sphingomonas solaris]TVV74056.1 phasin family protein [Sphingomonas solaris]
MAEDTGKSATDRITEPLKAAGEALRGVGTKAAENSSAISLTVLDHAEQNSRQAFAALRAAAGATSAAELMKVQGDYVREQSNRSVEQARQIGDLITRFGRAMMTPPGKREE